MTWHRSDGSTYVDRDLDPRPTIELGHEQWLGSGMAPRAAEPPQDATEPDRTPVHPARDRLDDVLARIKAGEFSAIAELPGAMANARKEARR